MMLPPKSRTALGLSTAVSFLVLQASPVFAFEPTGNEVADAFLTLLDSEDGTVESYETIDGTGGTVSINGIVITSDDDDLGKVTIAKTHLSDGEIQPDGRLKLSGLQLEDLVMTADDGGMTLKTMSVSDLLLPSPEEVKNKSAAGPGYSSLEINTVEISDKDGKVADVAQIVSMIDGMDGDLPTSGKFAVTGVTVDVKEIEAKEAKSLTDLGYERLSLNISGSGQWDPDAATLVIPDLKIDGQDAAALSLSLSLGGITRDLVTKLNENADKPEEAMGLLQGITVANIKIRLDDSSLTGRILDQEAQKAGIETSQYVSGLTGTLPLMLGMLQNKDLEKQVADAVTTYLNNPGSLEITAAPGAPVPMAQLMGTAMIAPQMIPQILAVGITANQ